MSNGNSNFYTDKKAEPFKGRNVKQTQKILLEKKHKVKPMTGTKNSNFFIENFPKYKSEEIKDESSKDFIEVLTRIDDLFYSFKFEGAAAGILNANIIARDLGLKDAKDHTSSDGTMTPKIIVSSEKTKTEIEKLNDWF